MKYSSDHLTDLRRKTIEKDVRAFLDSGRTIEQVPTGVSGQDQLGRSKTQIMLGNRRSR